MRFPKKSVTTGAIFLLINFFFFLPGYLLNLGGSSFFPSTTLPDGESLGALFHLFARDNQDVFRLSAEWLLIASILWMLRKWKLKSIVFWLSLLSFSILYLYQIYLQFSLKTYGEIPNFLNDGQLAKEVLPLFLDQFSQGNKSLIYLGMGLLVAILITIHAVLIRWYTRSLQKIGQAKWAWMIILGAFLLIAPFTYKNGKSSYPPIFNSVQWTSVPFMESLRDSRPKSEELIAAGAPFQTFFEQSLAQKPDVYLLFVESYGEVLYRQEELKEAYLPLVRKMEDSLSRNGFLAQSILSESPIMGGKSWQAFTSAMCGITVDNQLMFNELLRITDYPHLIRFFNHQGYQTLRIKSMSDDESSVKAGYKKPTKFYGFDQWLIYNDIPYQGYKYDWFGGIPDQYALNYVDETIVLDSGQSRFLFYINMNSHGPWFPQAPILEDWRKLDTIPRLADELIDFEALLSAPVGERYINAIEYQLAYLSQFILKHAERNSIFILIGDHQPALIYRQGIDGFHTPMHIISKDTAFVERFAEKGFFPGLEITEPGDTSRQVKHADFYALFIEELLAVYGERTDQAILGKNEANISR